MAKNIGGSAAGTRQPEYPCNRLQQIGCTQRTPRRRVDSFDGEYVAQAAMAKLQPTVVSARQCVGSFAGKLPSFVLPQYSPELSPDT